MRFGLGALEISVLQVVSELTHSSITQLAKQFNISKSRASRTINSLKEKGFLTIEQKGRKKFVSFAHTAHAAAWRDVILLNPRLDIKGFLTNSTIRVLSGFDEEGASVKKAARITHTPEITVRRVLSKLRKYAIVRKPSPAKYAIRIHGLQKFVQDYCSYNLEQKCGGVRGFIQIGPNALLYAPELVKPGLNLTGVSLFHNYGIQLIQTDYRYYYVNLFAKKTSKPTMEQAVTHSLVYAKFDNDVRQVTYLLLVMEKNWKRFDKKMFLQEADDFNVMDLAQQALKRIEQFKYHEQWPEHTPGGFMWPSYEEFQELVKQYE